jgi:hypothetical protein
MVAPCTVVTCSADIATSATPTVAVDACERFPRRASWIAVPFTAASREANRGSGWVLDPIRIPRVRTNSARFKVRNRCGARWKLGMGALDGTSALCAASVARFRFRRGSPLPPRLAVGVTTAVPSRPFQGRRGAAAATWSVSLGNLAPRSPRSAPGPACAPKFSAALRACARAPRGAVRQHRRALARSAGGVPSRSSQRTKRWS